MTDKKHMNPYYNQNVINEENKNEHHISCEADKKNENKHNTLLNGPLKEPDQLLREKQVADIVRKYRELRQNRVTNNRHKKEGNEGSKDRNSTGETNTNTSSSKVSDETNRPFDARETDVCNYANNAGIEQISKDYCNKTTYCRPVVSYSQEFINKILEKNCRLKRLVKKLALARQQEQGSVLWNNYINDLKNKHYYNHINNNHHPIFVQNREEITSETIENYYNTEFHWTFSKPCNVLLDELYAVYNYSPSKSINQESQASNYYKSMCRQTYPNDSLCYPTSSQGRLYALQKERFKKMCHKNRASEAKLNENSVLIQHSNTSPDSKRSIFTQSDIQIDHSISTPFKYYNDKAVIADIEKGSEDLLVHKIQKHKKSSKCKSVISIESKLETLIESVNTFINEMRLHRERSKENNTLTDKKYKTIQYDVHEIAKEKPELDDPISKGSKNYERQTIQNELKYKSDKGFQSIPLKRAPKSHTTRSKTYDEIMNLNENIFRNSYTTNFNKDSQECSVQISFEIPTRDCSTEVTKSLSHHIHVDKNVSENNNSNNSAITVAINTDPLSLIALLKISSDTLKGLLSFVPNIDYHSYLSYLPLPKLQWGEAHCVCPDTYTLNTLLQNNSNCVYQQLFDKAFVGPFKCKYCRKTFTRAYCWELHQLTCARSLGRGKEDPSLMLLK